MVSNTEWIDLTDDRIRSIREIPARAAEFVEAFPLTSFAQNAVHSIGIEKLYSHQASAIEAARRGENVVTVTGTASGKSICYHVPVLESLADGNNTAIYLFPTKALAQDQLRGVKRLLDTDPARAKSIVCGTYDGDTSQHARRKLRTHGNLILTNPDMLHAGILPNHAGWARFFENLRYVIVDEIHAYRGIFGSNVGNVFRRLRRIATHYGASPQFLCSSATIANPAELAERILGEPVTVVDRDGSPRGMKRFLLWNPPKFDPNSSERRSANIEAKNLMVQFVLQGIPTIVFARSRITAELIYRYAREDLLMKHKKLADKIAVYRGGYLPKDRREIERRLFEGDLLGVTSTNALELGIDVGSLGVSILVGFPGTIASTWQQAGRAGRTEEESMSILITYNDPIDQYLARHPAYFFDQTPENAIVDSENPYILARHLACAAHELPIEESEDVELFGANMAPVLDAMEEHEKVMRLKDKWYWSSTDYPAAEVSLRNMADATFTITEIFPNGQEKERTIGTVDAISAPELLYPEAIYLHDGETYFVRELDLDQRVAYVERREVDYYTQAIVESTIRLGKGIAEAEVPDGKKMLAQATVSWMTVAFKKIQFQNMDSIGWGKLDLPSQELETVAMGLHVEGRIVGRLADESLRISEGLAGLRNLLLVVAPLFAMCDRSNLGGVVESSNTGVPTLFLYDRYPFGLGYSEKCFHILDEILHACLELVGDCPCDDGCPSCVGMPRQPVLHHDPDTALGIPMPDKRATKRLLEMLGEESGAPAESGVAPASATSGVAPDPGEDRGDREQRA
ncbi:MAG: DEAD/DEAH box helicase [Gemmatimonadetes bacterium]|nr:DEAD/DEAH box helicase [Gemmatimonadota bacterium]